MNGLLFTSIGELDQLRAFARGADLEVVQLCPGRMSGVVAHCDLGASSLHLNQLSLPARGRGALSTERWTFVIFPEQVQGCFNGATLSGDSLLAYPPGAEFEGTIASAFHDWILTVDLDELSETYSMLFHRELRLQRSEFQVLWPDPATIRQLRTVARQMLNPFGASMKLPEDSQVGLLHQQIVELLATSLHSASPDRDQPQAVQMSRWAIVSRAEELMRGQADQPISLTMLCRQTQTSERSLRRAFLDVVGVSPMSYLTAIRMNRACAELQRTSGESSTVTSIASRWQFMHLGRFAGAYRRFFGELPSDTLLRPLGAD